MFQIFVISLCKKNIEMAQTAPNDKNLNKLQLEFLRSLKYMATEEQLADIKSLLRHYFARQLDDAIEKAENVKNYTAAVYDSWLKTNPGITKPQSGK